MHRKSQTLKSSTQNKQSQLSQSQGSQSQQANLENEEALVQNCVRYLIYKTAGGAPIRKADIQKLVLKNVGKHFGRILNKAKEVLNEVYGYDLYECDDGQSAVHYLISNSLAYKSNTHLNSTQQMLNNELDVPEDVNKILVMLVLTHIFMSNNTVTQNSLFSFLQLLKIDVETRHQIFGNVKTFVTSTMINQRYLVQENDAITKNIVYKWGPRAEHEISKHELLKFACKIYKDRNPKSFTSQFEIATTQFGAPGNHQNEVEQMELDD